jgi:6-pyruvoyl-tetrahydropterin synthase related domain
MTDLNTSPEGVKSRLRPDWLLPLGVFLLLSILIVLPFFWMGTASGHDFDFHAASWLDVASQWKQGVLFPRWAAWMNYGFGEPRYIFYPPLSWLIGAALMLALPGAAVPIVFIVLLQTFAGMSAYVLVRNLASRCAAILAAACYLINPNMLLMSYIRSDYAEQLACAIFPLLLLAGLRVAQLLDESPRNRSSVALFAIAFAAVWLSNAPAGVLASYSMALLFVWAALSQRSWRPLLRGAAGLALGLCLAAFYLLPAAYEQRWVNISQALASGLLPYQNFLFTSIDDVEHTWFNWIASICALCLMVLLGPAAVASRRFSSGQSSGRERKLSVALLSLGAAATLLTLRFTLPLWKYLPKLQFVQFPWRWMSIIALVACCFVAFAMERRRGWVWFAAIVVLSAPLGAFLVNNTWWDDDEMPTLRDNLVQGHGFEGTDEYDPLGDDHTNLPVDAPLVRILPADPDNANTPTAHFQVQRWTTVEKQVRVDSAGEARVALRLLNYPAWRVQVNGKAIEPQRMDDFNQMVVPVQAGKSEIRVRFVRTMDRTLGGTISTIGVFVAALMLWAGRKKAVPRSASFLRILPS